MSATTVQRALTDEFSSQAIPSGIAWGVADNSVGLKGTIGVIDLSTGYLKMGVTGTGLVCAGVISENWDNTGVGHAAGIIAAAVRQGVFPFYMGTGGDAITNLNVGSLCYIIDNQTVGLTDGGATRSIAGIIQFLAPVPNDTNYQQVYVQMGAYVGVVGSGSAVAGALLVSGNQSNTGVKTFSDSTLVQNNAGGTFGSTLHSAATAARSFTLPDIASATAIVNAGAQSITGVKTFTFAAAPLINNSADTFSTQLLSAATANRSFQFPDIASAVGMALSGAQTVTGVKTFTFAGTPIFNNAADTFGISFASTVTANRTWTYQNSSDTVVGRATTDTLTNKTLTTPTLTTPLISTGLTASGSASNDFSASTGTMKTSTGIFTVSGGLNAGQGTISQATNVNTGVTVNAASGVITTQSATTAALTAESGFTLTNSAIVAASVVIVRVVGYSGTLFTNGQPDVSVAAPGSGTVAIKIINRDPTNALSGTMKLHFIIC